MYVIDGIAYAGELPKSVKVHTVEPLNDYKLLITFSTGERKIFDFKPLLDLICYQPLKDEITFSKAYVEYGTVVWNDSIDIAPETLYEQSIAVSDTETA